MAFQPLECNFVALRPCIRGAYVDAARLYRFCFYPPPLAAPTPFSDNVRSERIYIGKYEINNRSGLIYELLSLEHDYTEICRIYSFCHKPLFAALPCPPPYKFYLNG